MILKKWIPTVLKLAFAIALIYWLVATNRFQLSELKNFLTLKSMAISLVIVAIHLIVITERWRQLLKSQGLALNIYESWKLSLVGLFFSFAVPGGVGGDVMKAFLLQKDFHAKRAVAYSSALVDRIIGLYAFVLLALAGLIFEIQTQSEQSALLMKLLNWILLLFVLITAGIFAIAKVPLPRALEDHPGLGSKIFRFTHACRSYFSSPQIVLKAVLITFSAQIITLFFFYWFFNSIMNESVTWPLLFFAVPLGFMLMAVPLTPAGIGIGQAAFFFLFNTFSGGAIKSGSAAITAFQLTLFVWGLVGAFYFLFRKIPIPTTQQE